MVYVSVPFVLRAFCTYREGCPLHRLRKTYYLLHLNERLQWDFQWGLFNFRVKIES